MSKQAYGSKYLRIIGLTCQVFVFISIWLLVATLQVHAEARATDPVTTWISQHADPLRTVQPGGSDTDLQPLQQMVGNASIVGLGEATHGTHEFFTLKARILEYLVTKMGFSTFVMEIDTIKTVDTDSYNYTLGQVAYPIYMIDLRNTPAGLVMQWANGPHPFLLYGLGGEEQSNPIALKQQFDVIVHVQKTTPAQSQIGEVSFWGGVYDHFVLLIVVLICVVVITGGIVWLTAARRRKRLTVVTSVEADEWTLKRDTT